MQKINKEEIKNLSFLKADVLNCKTEQKKRFYVAQKARTLGNIEKSKATINFHTTDGIYEVSTTVWDVDKDFIMLKCATALPMRSVYSIDL